MAKSQFVYFFGDGKAEGDAKMKNELGGKGANLAEMTNLGIPVPPGFTISTEVCKLFYENDKNYPEGLKEEVAKNLEKLEKLMGKKLGDEKDPLLVSVRSGAAISMPGMMDTILNLGMNDKAVVGVSELTGNPRFAWDSYRRFIQMFGDVAMGVPSEAFEDAIDEIKKEKNVTLDTDLDVVDLQKLVANYKNIYKKHTGNDFPQDPIEQMWGAINAVFGSWMNDRAIKYRSLNNIKGLAGTAVNIQSMVFGNFGDDSGTGVCFSRDPSTGVNQFYGEYLMNAQGEDVVAGIRTPAKIDKLEQENKEVFALAMEMRFEEAQAIKEKYDLIENYRAKSEVVSRIIHNVDVFSIEMDEGSAYINYLHITNGCVNQAFTFEYKKRLNETKEELLQLGIVEMRERYKSKSREIIVPFELEMELNGVTFIVPQRGEKKHLLELSILNVKQYKVDRLKQADKLNPEQKKTRILKEIQEQLHLSKIPAHIECFDNSNIQGSDAVAACVVFKMGKPSKKDYRKFNIKTVVGPDDYASMKEVVRRRYTRAIEEQSPLPDLIITDGGKGQMEVVREVIEDELNLQIPIAGLAKDNKHRTSELLYGFPPMTIGVKQSTPLFHLLENIQDEVHRFAITFHRDKRSKSQTASVLDDIPGIGEKRKTALLKAFKSVSRIKKASLEELAEIIGPSAAKNLQEKLQE